MLITWTNATTPPTNRRETEGAADAAGVMPAATADPREAEAAAVRRQTTANDPTRVGCRSTRPVEATGGRGSDRGRDVRTADGRPRCVIIKVLNTGAALCITTFVLSFRWIFRRFFLHQTLFVIMIGCVVVNNGDYWFNSFCFKRRSRSVVHKARK